MSEQPPAPSPTSPDPATAATPSDPPPPHEGDHRDTADARTEAERELAETVRSISRLEESN